MPPATQPTPVLPRPWMVLPDAANDQHKHPDDHAIVVGINHYLPGIEWLRGALNDCQLFCEWLVDETGGGLNPANITYYGSKDPPDQLPFRDQIEDLMLRFFQRRLETGKPVGRRLYIFMSGHGVAPPNSDEDDCGLVMANALPTALRALVGGKAAKRVRRAALFEEVFLVMDCCQEVAGMVVADCGLPDFSDPTLGKRPFLHVLAAGWGSTTAERMMSHPTKPDADPLHHGVLTHALLQGLKLATDATGEITAASLKPFVRQTVQAMLEAGDPRLPSIQFEEDLPPMSFGKSKGVQVTLKLRAGTVDYRVRRGIDLEQMTPEAERTGDTVRIWLPPALYLLEGLDANGAVISSITHNALAGGPDVRL